MNPLAADVIGFAPPPEKKMKKGGEIHTFTSYKLKVRLKRVTYVRCRSNSRYRQCFFADLQEMNRIMTPIGARTLGSLFIGVDRF